MLAARVSRMCCMFRYAKLVLWNGRVQGALFVSLGDGEHDVETFENLILSQAKFPRVSVRTFSVTLWWFDAAVFLTALVIALFADLCG
jgi:hypothetical protein